MNLEGPQTFRPHWSALENDDVCQGELSSPAAVKES